MILSKGRTSVSSHGDRSKLHSSSQTKRASVPDLLRLLEARDYTGAITLLQFKRLVRADLLQFLQAQFIASLAKANPLYLTPYCSLAS
jgi:hypothetical protein